MTSIWRLQYLLTSLSKVKGKWVGEWKMSKGAERLLKKMVCSNADIRITAKEAMKDLYWSESQIPVSSTCIPFSFIVSY